MIVDDYRQDGVTDAVSVWFARRLLELAPNYFDLSAFPNGETKRALLAVAKKRTSGSRGQSAEADGRKAKKAKR